MADDRNRTGRFAFDLTDLLDEVIAAPVRVDLTPVDTTYGQTMRVVVAAGTRRVSVAGLACHPNSFVRYRVDLWTKNFKHYSTLQTIVAGHNPAGEGHIRLAANPSRVSDIVAPGFTHVPSGFRRAMAQADMWRMAEIDEDLVGKSGPVLYDALGPLRKACILNLAWKAGHSTSARISRYVRALHVLRQDRCFATVDPAIHAAMCHDERFVPVDGSLHATPPGYRRHSSFKTLDSHANLQVTLMVHPTTGHMVADVDIDERSGIAHGTEVIRNTITGNKTHPYLIRELLLLAREAPIDPGYRFIFKAS